MAPPRPAALHDSALSPAEYEAYYPLAQAWRAASSRSAASALPPQEVWTWLLQWIDKVDTRLEKEILSFFRPMTSSTLFSPPTQSLESSVSSPHPPSEQTLLALSRLYAHSRDTRHLTRDLIFVATDPAPFTVQPVAQASTAAPGLTRSASHRCSVGPANPFRLSLASGFQAEAGGQSISPPLALLPGAGLQRAVSNPVTPVSAREGGSSPLPPPPKRTVATGASSGASSGEVRSPGVTGTGKNPFRASQQFFSSGAPASPPLSTTSSSVDLTAATSTTSLPPLPPRPPPPSSATKPPPRGSSKHSLASSGPPPPPQRRSSMPAGVAGLPSGSEGGRRQSHASGSGPVARLSIIGSSSSSSPSPDPTEHPSRPSPSNAKRPPPAPAPKSKLVSSTHIGIGSSVRLLPTPSERSHSHSPAGSGSGASSPATTVTVKGRMSRSNSGLSAATTSTASSGGVLGQEGGYSYERPRTHPSPRKAPPPPLRRTDTLTSSSSSSSAGGGSDDAPLTATTRATTTSFRSFSTASVHPPAPASPDGQFLPTGTLARSKTVGATSSTRFRPPPPPKRRNEDPFAEPPTSPGRRSVASAPSGRDFAQEAKEMLVQGAREGEEWVARRAREGLGLGLAGRGRGRASGRGEESERLVDGADDEEGEGGGEDEGDGEGLEEVVDEGRMREIERTVRERVEVGQWRPL